MIDTEINSKNYREIAADIALNSEEISLEIMWELEDEYELVPEHFKELDDMVIRDCGYGDALDALNLLAKYADVSTVYYRILDRAVDGIMKAIEIDRPDLIYDHE